MFKKILVALDGSPRAGRVFEVALDVASRYAAVLIPFHAIAIPPDFPPAAHVPTADPLPEFLHKEAAARFQALHDAYARSSAVVIRPLTIADDGSPSSAILAAAEREGVDLIVLGSHGYHGLDRVLGTTAGRVANLATRNVMVVHNRLPSAKR